MKLLKGTMFGLADYAGDPTKKHLDEIRNARELAFLITDLEGSTALAAADAKAFRHIQEIHDAVRKLIVTFGLHAAAYTAAAAVHRNCARRQQQTIQHTHLSAPAEGFPAGLSKVQQNLVILTHLPVDHHHVGAHDLRAM